MSTTVKPTHRKHNPYHDYQSRCIYHITLVVSDRVKALGRMTDARYLGQPTQPDGSPWIEAALAKTAKVELTPLGYEISEAINAIPYVWGKLGVRAQILQKVVMPEHVHFILFVQEPTPMRLQKLMRGWKQGCNKRLRRYLGLEDGMGGASGGSMGGSMGGDVENAPRPDENINPSDIGGNGAACSVEHGLLPSGMEAFVRPSSAEAFSCNEGPSGTGGVAPFLMEAVVARRRVPGCEDAGRRLLEDHALFEEDFDETRLRRKGQLKMMIAYVHNNPKHRWLRDHKPNWLLPIRGIEIAGRMYDALGNVNLLALQRYQNHTRYMWYQSNDTEAVRRHMNDCVIHARKNYAIVSPFVHPDEARVRDFCLQEGHAVIVLCDNGFSDLQQCPGGLYDYCVNGQVLMLVPADWPHIDHKGKCTREECHILNDYANEIVEEI